MPYETLLFDVSDGVATLTLDRPEALNAVNDQMGRELLDALRTCGRNAEVRAVVLTGSGRAFCAGQDLKEVEEGSRSYGRIVRSRYNPIVLAIRRLERPVVAGLNGIAAGAGVSLALACDLVVASEGARLTMAFSRAGLVPDSGSTYWLPRLIGYHRAFELMALAEPLTARQAHHLGLVNRVVEDGELPGAARELALRLASGPTAALAYTKRALDQALDSSLEEALEYEAHMQELAGRTRDHREGIAAFVEKREPRFEGR